MLSYARKYSFYNKRICEGYYNSEVDVFACLNFYH